jgi:hypothetical protein
MPRVYASADRRRFFLVPDDVALPPGGFPLSSLTGGTVSVDDAQLAAYEIDEEAARAWVEKRRQIAADLVRELNAWATAIAQLGRDIARPAAPERVAELLRICGISEDELARDPKAALARVLRKIRDDVGAGGRQS